MVCTNASKSKWTYCIVVVLRLLAIGAQVDLQNKDGWSALMLACQNQHSDIVQNLLASGAQVDLQMEYVWSAYVCESELI